MTSPRIDTTFACLALDYLETEDRKILQDIEMGLRLRSPA